MRQSYTQEFKQDIVDYCKSNPEIPKTRIAEEFGISSGVLYKWLEASLKGKQTVTRLRDSEAVKDKKRIRELEMENKVLRAAAAYFAKDALPK